MNHKFDFPSKRLSKGSRRLSKAAKTELQGEFDVWPIDQSYCQLVIAQNIKRLLVRPYESHRKS